jgi:hypothetical protein
LPIARMLNPDEWTLRPKFVYTSTGQGLSRCRRRIALRGFRLSESLRLNRGFHNSAIRIESFRSPFCIIVSNNLLAPKIGISGDGR